MSELPPASDGERETLRVGLGDVVRFTDTAKPFSHDRDYLVAEPPTEDGRIEVMTLPTDKQPVYGSPGTELVKNIAEVKYRLDDDQLAQVLALAGYNPGRPYPPNYNQRLADAKEYIALSRQNEAQLDT